MPVRRIFPNGPSWRLNTRGNILFYKLQTDALLSGLGTVPEQAQKVVLRFLNDPSWRAGTLGDRALRYANGGKNQSKSPINSVVKSTDAASALHLLDSPDRSAIACALPVRIVWNRIIRYCLSVLLDREL